MSKLIETPCTKICVIDPVTSFCIGCGRSGNEVAGWINYTPAERRGVMMDLPHRLARMTISSPRAPRERQRQR
jgi:uncharacterized protein